jgi:ketosteroid isomerase-like protein
MERPREEEPETVREGIGALVTKLLAASRKHNAEECAALFTEDGSILSPYGVEVRGQKAIEATHKEWFDQGEANKRLELLECDAGGDVGYCILAYAVTTLNQTGHILRKAESPLMFYGSNQMVSGESMCRALTATSRR